VTLTSTLDRVILHTVVHHSSTYRPDVTEIEETVCGRTDVRTYGRTDGHLRPTLLGRLRRVDLITIIIIIIKRTTNDDVASKRNVDGSRPHTKIHRTRPDQRESVCETRKQQSMTTKDLRHGFNQLLRSSAKIRQLPDVCPPQAELSSRLRALHQLTVFTRSCYSIHVSNRSVW